MLRVYLPASIKIVDGTAFLPNLFKRYFDASEFAVLSRCDDTTRLILLPCSNAYRLSRKLAAIKGNGIFAYDALPEADRAALRQRKKKLVLDMGSEVFFTRPEMIDGMHEGLAEIGVERSQTLIVNGDASAGGNYLAYCEAKKIADPVPVLMTNANPLFFLAHHRMSADAFQEYAAGIQEQRAAHATKKVFLNFNGRSRPHRIYAVLQLMAHGLMDAGFVSLLDYNATEQGTALRQRDPGVRDAAAARLRGTIGRWPKADMCLAHLDALLDKLPLELDLSAREAVVDKRYGHVTPWQMPDLELYHRSYLSLVTDSNLPSDNSLFVTEKVIKTFVAFHPAIYVGGRGALELLRSLGFQTFHPLIDESYDLEPHGAARLTMAIDQLKRLASLPEAELRDLYAKLWPRLLHNARHACVDAPAWAKDKLDREIRQRLLAFASAA